jgi:hypothetical protein
MPKPAHFLIWALICVFCTQINQAQRGSNQNITTFADLHVHSSTKPFNSRNSVNKYNIWESIDHSCGSNAAERSPEIINGVVASMQKQSQSDLKQLARSNTRVVCVTISPLEHQFMNNSAYLNDKNKKATISCLTGVSPNQIFLQRREIDYFQEVLDNIEFIKKGENKPYYINGDAYTYMLLRTPADLDTVLNNPYKIGIVLNIEGGHALGHSLYTNLKITNVKDPQTKENEYERLLIDNILKLKGLKPIYDSRDDSLDIYLDVPIMYIGLAKTFPNGLGGTAQSLTQIQETYFSTPEEIGAPMTSVGSSVVAGLFSSGDGGRPIYIDIKHMSPQFREKYYREVSSSLATGGNTKITNISIIASHVGISGLPFTSGQDGSALYNRPDSDPNKNNNSFLSDWQQSLSKEDLKNIYDLKGLIGISLDKNTIGGTVGLKSIQNTQEGTVQRRQACLDLFLANVFKAIRVMSDEEKEDSLKYKVWNLICVGSDFDAMMNPLDVYASARNMPDLHSDIQRFLEDPQPIVPRVTGLEVPEIRRLMFGLKPAEIANKICSTNMVDFVRKFLEQQTIK